MWIKIFYVNIRRNINFAIWKIQLNDNLNNFNDLNNFLTIKKTQHNKNLDKQKFS